jgi:hypothetical protein
VPAVRPASLDDSTSVIVSEKFERVQSLRGHSKSWRSNARSVAPVEVNACAGQYIDHRRKPRDAETEGVSFE